jgi:hypothetical protein
MSRNIGYSLAVTTYHLLSVHQVTTQSLLITFATCILSHAARYHSFCCNVKPYFTQLIFVSIPPFVKKEIKFTKLPQTSFHLDQTHNKKQTTAPPLQKHTHTHIPLLSLSCTYIRSRLLVQLLYRTYTFSANSICDVISTKAIREKYVK